MDLGPPPAGFVALRELWHPSPLTGPQLRFGQDLKTIVLAARMPLPEDPLEAFPSGGPLTELWRNDVAELFLGSVESGRYVELNLSPGGAWWAGWFTAPHVPADAADLPPLNAVAGARWNDRGWNGRLTVSRAAVDAFLGLSGGWRANLTAVVKRDKVRRFFSAADLGGEKPDFHRPTEWLEIGGR